MSSTANPLTTRTNPMSGVFTPPSSCSSHWTYEGQAANSVTGGLLIQNAGAGQNDEPCYPPGFGGWGRAPSYIQIFSPGVCPSGYTTANNNYNGQTTTAVCCLSNFSYTNFISSVNAGGKTAQYYGCTSMFTNSGPTTVFAEGEGDGITSSLDGITGMFTAVSGLITMWAQPITVAFQQNDLSLFTTSHTSTSITSATTTSGSPTTSSSTSPEKSASPTLTVAATSSSSSESSSLGSRSTSSLTSSIVKAATSQVSSSSLSNGAGSSSGVSVLGSSIPTTSAAQLQSPRSGPSTGAIAGIVIGAVALLAIIIGAALVFRRQRRPTTSTRNLDLMDVQMAQKGHSGYALRDPSCDSSRKRPAELHQEELVELPNYRSSRQHELP